MMLTMACARARAKEHTTMETIIIIAVGKIYGISVSQINVHIYEVGSWIPTGEQ